VALSRQSAAADGRAVQRRRAVEDHPAGPKPTAAGEGPSIAPRRSGPVGAHDGRRRAPAGRTGLAPVAPSAPDPAEHVQRRSAAVPSCWWAGIWKRFHMVHCGRPGTGARARTAVGTHSRGTWIDFRLIFNSVAGSNPPEALRRGGSGAVQVPTSRRPAGRVWDGRRSLLQRPASGSALNMWKRFQMPAHGGKGLRVVWGRFSDCFFIGV
jgi:hypothetical protein